MPIIAKHFSRLKDRFPNATLSRLPNGSALVTVPGFALKSGWAAQEVTLRFLAPNGYPVAAPDCFWVEPELRLLNAQPQNSAFDNQIPETAIRAHWFSWHVEAGRWSPNRHDLLTWLNLCSERLQRIQ